VYPDLRDMYLRRGGWRKAYEEVHVAQHPELGALMHVAQVGIHEFSALRTMDFHR